MSMEIVRLRAKQYDPDVKTIVLYEENDDHFRGEFVSLYGRMQTSLFKNGNVFPKFAWEEIGREVLTACENQSKSKEIG